MRIQLRILLAFLATLVCALWFFWRAPHAWPLLETNLAKDQNLIAKALLQIPMAQQENWSEWDQSITLLRDEPAMVALQATFGTSWLQDQQAQGLPLVYQRALLKKKGRAERLLILVHPQTGLLGYAWRPEPDSPGDSLTLQQADLRLPSELLAAPWVRVDAQSQVQESGRIDHRFTYEKELGKGFRLRRRILLSGNQLAQDEPYVHLPAHVLRENRTQDAKSEGVAMAAIIAILAFAAIAIGTVFRSPNSSGYAKVAGRIVGFIGIALVATYALDQARIFNEWDPLWPQWLAAIKSVLLRLSFDIPLLLLLFFLILAARTQSNETIAVKSLWNALSLKWNQPGVGEGLLAGYPIAFVAGAILTLSLAAIEKVGGLVQLQPQGFFGWALNSSAPAWSTLIFFLVIALSEEVGYRLFAVRYLAEKFRNRAYAVILTSVVFGMIHATLTFLPPMQPWWGRVALMSLVGAWWGYAMFKWGALAVVSAHWAADLFIFNWPRIQMGGEHLVSALVTVCAPLLLGLTCRIWQRYSQNLRTIKTQFD